VRKGKSHEKCKKVHVRIRIMTGISVFRYQGWYISVLVGWRSTGLWVPVGEWDSLVWTSVCCQVKNGFGVCGELTCEAALVGLSGCLVVSLCGIDIKSYFGDHIKYYIWA
jgi:hypothetical protein